MNSIFAQWLSSNYAGLINLPPTNPAMLHHVSRHLARELEETKDGRVALLVIDGLALDQWVTIRQTLQEHDRSLVMRESATFAWIPTLTPYPGSRSSLVSHRSISPRRSIQPIAKIISGSSSGKALVFPASTLPTSGDWAMATSPVYSTQRCTQVKPGRSAWS